MKKRYIVILFAVLLFLFCNFSVKITRTEIISDKITDSVKIVQLTDLHGRPFGDVLTAVRKEKPDIVAVTGDLYTFGDTSGKNTALEFLRELASEFRVYFVNGEHDNDSDFIEKLRESGVSVLDYRDEIISVGNTELHIYGITNVYYSPTFDLSNAFEPDRERFSLLFAHMQNFEKFSKFGIDLSLCGDSHGGIFRLPFLGAVYDGDRLFPELSGKYVKGLYSNGDSLLYISAGLGNYPLPLRFFNRPEISVITLMPK